ncbi:hypothetical protein TUMSATVNIG3_57170 (plasmid) [Vibrio nigripulchritudo]|nr:hypothetical protein TUMSATVNIG2_56230 [Vibrio nigripulchritudo]BDU46919.1 hypothetical protein TUMSATVNIG3_57170 [Vibrio nigripulchritudo]
MDRAIVCHRSACDFIFDNLESDDLDGTQFVIAYLVSDFTHLTQCPMSNVQCPMSKAFGANRYQLTTINLHFSINLVRRGTSKNQSHVAE